MSSRSSASPSRAIGLLIAAVVALTAAPLWAESVAVLPIDGKSTDAVEDGIRDLVRDSFSLISPKRSARAWRSQRRNPQWSELADDLGAEVLVTGDLKAVRKRIKGKKRRRFRLRLQFRAASGREIGSTKVYLVKRKLSRDARRDIEDALRRAIEDELYAEDSGEDAVDSDRDDSGTEADDRRGDDDRDDADEDPIGGDDDASDPRVERKAVRGPRPLPAVVVRAGLNVSSRSLNFSYAESLADEPQGYAGFPFAGAAATVDVFPGAFDERRRGLAANLGIRLHYDTLLSASSAIEGRADTSIETRQAHYGATALARFALGDTPDSTMLEVGLGYHSLAFEIDQSGVPADVTIDVPNVGYRYVDPGIGVSVAATNTVNAYGGVRYLHGLGIGDAGSAMQYGKGGLKGGEFEAGVDIALTARAFLRGGVKAVFFSLSFDGSGALTDRDNDGNQDITGARDLYLHAGLAGGYRF